MAQDNEEGAAGMRVAMVSDDWEPLGPLLEGRGDSRIESELRL